MRKIRKGDKIIVVRGKDKGRKGVVEKILDGGLKVIIPGLNAYKRHLKRRDEKSPHGIIEFYRALPVSNVALICPKCGQKMRVGFIGNKKDKRRICKKCSQIID